MQYLPRPRLSQRLVQSADCLDVPQDVPVLLVVQHHVDAASVVEGVQHPHDVGVTQTGPHVQLTGQELGLEVRRSPMPEVHVRTRVGKNAAQAG